MPVITCKPKPAPLNPGESSLAKLFNSLRNMSDAEFLATAAEDRKALKDQIDRHTTARDARNHASGPWTAGTTINMGQSAYRHVRSATAEPKSRHGWPSTVGVAIGHVRTREVTFTARAALQLTARSRHETALHTLGNP